MFSEIEKLILRSEPLVEKFEQGEGISYIDDAITLDREVLERCPPGHPERLIPLSSLATHLSTRYRHLGATRDLEEAILLHREELGLSPAGHPDRALSLSNLANSLSVRYDLLGEMENLDEAIALCSEALDIFSKRHLLRSMPLVNLAVCLSTRYDRLGAIEDLDRAIILNREALELRPPGNPFRSNSLNNLAVALSNRYDRLGEMEDLKEATALHREALEHRPKGHTDRSESLGNVASVLLTRYERLGAIEDLDEAILHSQEALSLRPRGHPDRSMSLSNLAIRLTARYKKLGTMEDLDEAIVLDREALNLRPPGHPLRSSSLNNLAAGLSTRYTRLGIMEDLNEAIILDREALDSYPKGNNRRLVSLNNLAVDLFSRYKQLGEMEDLDEAIILGREALEYYPPGHPFRLTCLNNLAGYLFNRFIQSMQSRDSEEIFSLYAQLEHVSQVSSSNDLLVAKAWIRAAEAYRHPSLILAYETSLRLLIRHLATLPSLPRHLIILKNLTSSLAVDAFSACLRNHAPTHAVELLEQGRGVFLNQLARLRSPLDDVIESGLEGKALAEEFTKLVSSIRDTLSSPGTAQHEKLCNLNAEVERVVTNIRELPGLSRFLLPSLFSNLRHAASGGPVIILNESKYSCDAVVVFLDQDPVHIPLQVTQKHVQDLSTELRTLTVRAKRADVTRELAVFLRRLWDQIVSPIVDFLQTTLPSRSRIWWCPTGEFSALPLHAAGPFRKGQQNLPALYISSYTPTLTALIQARRSGPSNSESLGKHFITIGQGKAAGEHELISVSAELDIIRQRLEGLATFTWIDGEDSCISMVVEQLCKNEWVHFACHGIPNPKQPFESAFALHDGPLTIQQIIGCDLKNPEFAYLSACHTTVGDEESPDEVIHLASALQFAGFRSVIGTMWAVDDGETTKITSAFYKYMVGESGRLDHTRAAFALNKTMRSVDIPLDQRILYIHLGA